MSEAIRPSTERYQIRWGQRSGFAKLALETGAPVLMLVCPAADDIFHLYPNRLTDWIYRRYKFPLPVLRGLGPTIIPRPVRLRAFLSAPIEASLRAGADESVTSAFRDHVRAAMERHLAEAARSRS